MAALVDVWPRAGRVTNAGAPRCLSLSDASARLATGIWALDRVAAGDVPAAWVVDCRAEDDTWWWEERADVPCRSPQDAVPLRVPVVTASRTTWDEGSHCTLLLSYRSGNL